jgi:DNA cross-link repair 1B protein
LKEIFPLSRVNTNPNRLFEHKKSKRLQTWSKMVLITNTNIVVDDFNYGKSETKGKYIYFLTHMHSDHYGGLTSGFEKGPIYCSDDSKKIMDYRFPGLKNVHCIGLNVPFILKLNPSGSRSVEVTFFDSNHTPGSVMVLFRGYMGTILHTGDFRFSPRMLECNPVLFPEAFSEDQKNRRAGQRSIHIDELVYDNTYCDPIFNFPTRVLTILFNGVLSFLKIQDECLLQTIEIIRDHMPCRVFLNIYNLGKEELLISLAEIFSTLIVVSCDRYQEIKALGLRPDLFTTNITEGWILLNKKSIRESVQE